MSNKDLSNEEHRLKMKKITDIFKPWSNGGYGVTETYMLLDLGLLDYTSKKVEILSTPKQNFITESSGRETLPHINLKYTASQLLHKLGEDNPLFEYKLYDVFSPKLKIRIECGHTDPDRLLHSIIHDIEFWLLQYPKKDEELATLYKFSPSKGCKKVLKGYHSRGMEIIGRHLLEQYDENKKESVHHHLKVTRGMHHNLKLREKKGSYFFCLL